MRILLLTSLFLSTSVMACPALNGLHVNCIQSDGTITKVRIQQSQVNGVDRYKVDWNGQRTEIHNADGIMRETQIFDTGLAFHKTTTCEGDLLRHHVLMVRNDGGVQMDITQEYTLVNKKLHFRAIDENGVYNEIICRKAP
ncbi:MAG: hypothetical protein V4598_00730 [Bdellovibrionota bacterium]